MVRTIYGCGDGYYVCIKKYGDDDTYEDWFIETDREEDIYDKVMDLNGNDHDEAAGIASWCDHASVNSIWEFANGAGEVEIVYID